MTRQQFLQAVQSERAPPGCFSLDREENEAYVLLQRGDCWTVHYSERGLETGRSDFTSEADALGHLLALIRGDQTAKS